MRKKIVAYVDGLEVGNYPLEIGRFDAGDEAAAVAWAKPLIEPHLNEAEQERAIYQLEEY